MKQAMFSAAKGLLGSLCLMGMSAGVSANTGAYLYGDLSANVAHAGGGKPTVGQWAQTGDNLTLPSGGEFGVGYRSGSHLGFELGYSYLGRAGSHWVERQNAEGTAGRGTSTRNVRMQGFRLAVLGIYPVSDRFELFGSVGLFGVSYRADSAANNKAFKVRPAVGAGVTYRVTNAVHVRGQYQYINTKLAKPGKPSEEWGISNTHGVRVGLVYAF
jgi:OOP family OmpA-OmpF porin